MIAPETTHCADCGKAIRTHRLRCVPCAAEARRRQHREQYHTRKVRLAASRAGRPIPRTAAEVHVPTPAEIRARCLEVQAGWDDQERESRARWAVQCLAFPVFHVDNHPGRFLVECR